MFHRFAERCLTWWPAVGVGYYPVEAGTEPYDREYFDRFTRQADSEIGRALMDAREKLVAAFYKGELVDVGIGSGAFVNLRNTRGLATNDRVTLGYDVNPAGVAWLRERDLFCDPYQPRVRAVSLWDVLEHIPDFDRLLANVTQWVFTSLPIFRDAAHVLHSKHFRPTEHVWYFTSDGLIEVMRRFGFECMAGPLDMESALGREDIGTFVFRRNQEVNGHEIG